MKRFLPASSASVLAWLLFSIHSLAQGGWDMSGTWRVDPDKSRVVRTNVPAAGPDAPKAPPTPDSGPVEKIEQDLSDFKITRGIVSYKLVVGGPETVTKAQDGQEYHTKSHWDDNRLVTDWSVQQGRQLVRSGRIIRYLSKEDELVEDSTLNVQGAVHETQEVFIRVADEPADVTASEPSVFILSDTKGTDFGPYLAAMTASVRQKWFARMPISAKLGAQARVTAQFSILNDGSIEDLRLIDTTGSSPALDHAALDSIEESSPFSPLPAGFSGSKLSLWFIFRYNLDKVGGH